MGLTINTVRNGSISIKLCRRLQKKQTMLPTVFDSSMAVVFPIPF